MPWKSRIGKQPPSNFYAQVLAYLAAAYPQASISGASVSALKPLWDDLWLEGRTAEVVAKSTCSCDGKTITPSPVLAVPKLPKGAIRGPVGVARGTLFEPSQIRGSTEIEAQKRKRSAIQKEIDRLAAQATRLTARAGKSRTLEKRQPLISEIEERKKRIAERVAEVRATQEKLIALKRELGGVSRIMATEAEITEPKLPEVAPISQPKAKAAKEKKAPREKKAKEPKAQKPKEPKAQKPAKERKGKKSAELPTDEQDKKILASVEALLPGVAEKIAAALKQQGSG